MNEIEAALRSLEVGDKAHIYNVLYREEWPPEYRGIVIAKDDDSIVVQLDTNDSSKKRGALITFLLRNGTKGTWRVAPYSDKQELAMRVVKEKEALARKLNVVCWEALPLDVLDEICALLRENGVTT